MARQVIALVGPTAVGKTEVAMALADRYPVALISLDSALVYRGMDVGTAKPSREVLERYPHALIDIRDPADAYSAADFVQDADVAVRQALDAGRIPLLVGGTMLYLKAFREGIAQLPPADSALRARLVTEAEQSGTGHLYQRLEKVDPTAAAGIHPNNFSRVQRALEVFELTGRPLSGFWSDRSDIRQRLGVELRTVAVEPDSRRALHERISSRLEAMLAAGFVEEVWRLRERGDLHPDLPAMRAVGYRQIWNYLEGTGDQAAMRSGVLAATRQLARRQLTWLRSWPDLHHLEWGDAARLAASIGRQAGLDR